MVLGILNGSPKPSVLNIQGLAGFDRNKLTRRFGKLTENQLNDVKVALRDLLEI